MVILNLMTTVEDPKYSDETLSRFDVGKLEAQVYCRLQQQQTHLITRENKTQ